MIQPETSPSPVQIRTLTADEARAALPALTEILIDCVADGASVGFLAPFGAEEAATYWAGVVDAVSAGNTILIVAEKAGVVLGTVQLGIGLPPNQPHRADLKKLLVHRTGRNMGLARALMTAAETSALAAGSTRRPAVPRKRSMRSSAGAGRASFRTMPCFRTAAFVTRPSFTRH
jgi:GNAT superfamily N-acetyltransferase